MALLEWRSVDTGGQFISRDTRGEATMSDTRNMVRMGIYSVRKAGRALTITLPAEWVKIAGIEAGEKYEIYAYGRSLVLSPEMITK